MISIFMQFYLFYHFYSKITFVNLWQHVFKCIRIILFLNSWKYHVSKVVGFYCWTAGWSTECAGWIFSGIFCGAWLSHTFRWKKVRKELTLDSQHTPFHVIHDVPVRFLCEHNTLGMIIGYLLDRYRVYLKYIIPITSCSKIKGWENKCRGDYIFKIRNSSVVTLSYS